MEATPYRAVSASQVPQAGGALSLWLLWLLWFASLTHPILKQLPSIDIFTYASM